VSGRVQQGLHTPEAEGSSTLAWQNSAVAPWRQS
jgi:hypothetical protein